MTTLLELKQIFKNLFDKIDANFSVLATRISSNISGLKLLIEGPSSSDNNSAYYNKLNLKDKNNNVISTLLLKNLFANGHTAGIVAPDDDTTVVNNGYLSVNPNKYYNKTEVDTLVTNAVTSGQVDLSNYYTSNEVDALLSNKQAAGNYATSGSLSDFKTSTVLGHIADYSDITNPMITSNGSNITLKNGCKFGAYTLGQDVTLNVTTTNQTVNTSAGSVGTVYTNTAFAGTTGLYLIMYDISNQGQTVRVGFRHIDGFNSDSAAYSTMGYMGEFYWDGTSISNPTYYPNNDMEYKPRKLLYNAANTNANFKKLYDDLQDKVNTTDLSTVATSGSYNDLTNKPTIPAAQVQANWNETNSSSKAYIKNKPTIPTTLSAFTDNLGSNPVHTHNQYLTQHQDISGKANTADLATVATSGSYNDLSNKPTIPTVGNGTITITQDGTQKGTFTTNQSGNTTIDLDGGGSRNIGEIISSTIPLSDAGLHLLDGSLLGYGSYKDFIDYIASIYSASSNYFCTESEWQTSVTNYGVCGKFVYDSTNNTVRLPKITGFIEGTASITTLGDLTEAGLPNITGTVAGVWNGTCSGAIYEATHSGELFDRGDSGGTGAWGTLSFSASNSNSIYDNSTTVQPQSVKILYYIVVANKTKTEVEVDIDEIATDLNGKADKDLSNATFSSSVKNTIFGFGIPNFTSKINLNPTNATSGSYTTAAKGYIYVDFSCYAKTMSLYIDNQPMDIRTATGSHITSLNGFYPVDSGVTVSFANGYMATTAYSTQGIYFVPIQAN